MSFNLIKHLCAALNSDESALSKIGISIYDSEGKIKNVTAIFEEIAELWSKDLEEKIKNDCN
jgi:hypothetical protein